MMTKWRRNRSTALGIHLGHVRVCVSERNLGCLETVTTTDLCSVSVPQLVRVPGLCACALTCRLNRIMVAAWGVTITRRLPGRGFSPAKLAGLHASLPRGSPTLAPLLASVAR